MASHGALSRKQLGSRIRGWRRRLSALSYRLASIRPEDEVTRRGIDEVIASMDRVIARERGEK